MQLKDIKFIFISKTALYSHQIQLGKLVVRNEGNFIKSPTKTTLFTCLQYSLRLTKGKTEMKTKMLECILVFT